MMMMYHLTTSSLNQLCNLLQLHKCHIVDPKLTIADTNSGTMHANIQLLAMDFMSKLYDIEALIWLGGLTTTSPVHPQYSLHMPNLLLKDATWSHQASTSPNELEAAKSTNCNYTAHYHTHDPHPSHETTKSPGSSTASTQHHLTSAQTFHWPVYTDLCLFSDIHRLMTNQKKNCHMDSRMAGDENKFSTCSPASVNCWMTYYDM